MSWTQCWLLINMHACGFGYTVSTRLHILDVRLPWPSSPLGPGVVAALCRVPAQALVAYVRKAAPASTRPRIVLVTHLTAAGRQGVGARLSLPVALSGVLPRSWGDTVRDDGPVAVAVSVRWNGQGIEQLQKPQEERVWWQFVDGIRRWRECCAARRWRGGASA